MLILAPFLHIRQWGRRSSLETYIHREVPTYRHRVWEGERKKQGQNLTSPGLVSAAPWIVHARGMYILHVCALSPWMQMQVSVVGELVLGRMPPKTGDGLP